MYANVHETKQERCSGFTCACVACFVHAWLVLCMHTSVFKRSFQSGQEQSEELTCGFPWKLLCFGFKFRILTIQFWKMCADKEEAMKGGERGVKVRFLVFKIFMWSKLKLRDVIQINFSFSRKQRAPVKALLNLPAGWVCCQKPQWFPEALLIR